MKMIYIPKGQTMAYDTLETERLVVNGCLKVAHGLKAQTITGGGVILAGNISADDIRAREIEAASVCCLRLNAKRVQAAEVFASESAAVSCYLCADYVAADRLTVALHDVGKIDAREVIALPSKKRSLFRLLLASALRSFWTSLTARPVKAEVMDAEFKPAGEDESADEELNRIVGMFKLAREGGYTLKLIPGTPEENAPVFNMETGKIVRPAA